MIRYPGSKDKITRAIIGRFPDPLRMGGLFQQAQMEYREPFFGGGAVGFRVIRTLPPSNTVWLNDRDYGLCCLWKAVHQTPEELCDLVRRFRPSPDLFYRYQREDGRPDLDPVEIGFRKLALHQISFSGLGVMAGGPIGGRQQSSAYNVDCRWNPQRLCRYILERHRALAKFRSVRISAKDFVDLIQEAPRHAFIYADPPYVEKGGQLYKHNMSRQDHQRLAKALRDCRASWVLSYDDHPMVRELYTWARIDSVELTYTTAVADGKRRKNSEVIISPRALAA